MQTKTSQSDGNAQGISQPTPNRAEQDGGRKGGHVSVKVRRARAEALAALRTQLEPEATDGLRRMDVETAIALATTILKGQVRREKKGGMKRPDAKGLAACHSAYRDTLGRLGKLPEAAVVALEEPPEGFFWVQERGAKPRLVKYTAVGRTENTL